MIRSNSGAGILPAGWADEPGRLAACPTICKRQSHHLAKIQSAPRRHCAPHFPWRAPALRLKHRWRQFLHPDISPRARWRCSRCRCKNPARLERRPSAWPIHAVLRAGLCRRSAKNFQPNSASCSVSGRGTSTWRFTAISYPQNEVEPVMCWSGSRWPRRLMSSRSRRFHRRQSALEIQVQFHARHFQQMREQQFGLQARRFDIFFAEKFRAFLDRFEDGHTRSLNSNAGDKILFTGIIFCRAYGRTGRCSKQDNSRRSNRR